MEARLQAELQNKFNRLLDILKSINRSLIILTQVIIFLGFLQLEVMFGILCKDLVSVIIASIVSAGGMFAVSIIVLRKMQNR